jgi:hypothetical protein
MSGRFGLAAGGIRAADNLLDGDFTGAAINAGIGYGMHRMSQLPGAQNVVQHGLTQAAQPAAGAPPTLPATNAAPASPNAVRNRNTVAAIRSLIPS